MPTNSYRWPIASRKFVEAWQGCPLRWRSYRQRRTTSTHHLAPAVSMICLMILFSGCRVVISIPDSENRPCTPSFRFHAKSTRKGVGSAFSRGVTTSKTVSCKSDTVKASFSQPGTKTYSPRPSASIMTLGSRAMTSSRAFLHFSRREEVVRTGDRLSGLSTICCQQGEVSWPYLEGPEARRQPPLELFHA